MLKQVRTIPLVVALLTVLPRPAVAQPPDPSDAFFDPNVLHEIRLSVNSREWRSLTDHFQENTYYPADFRWKDQVVRNVEIRSRGTGSRRPNKPGLRVDFNRYTAGQTFLGLKSFILRNNSQDASNIRERLSMVFFRRMGLVAVREAHTRLYVNNEYIGLYTIVESPDRDFLQRNLGESAGHLYEFRYDNDAVLAGLPPFTLQYVGPNPALYVPIPFKPETWEDDPQGEVIARFIEAVSEASAALWPTAVSQYLDLGAFIRHLAIENFLAEEDGLTGDYGPNNFYFYRFVNTTRFVFLPWDKGNTFWEMDYSIFRNINDGWPENRNRLVLRAFEEPDLLQLYYDTLLECATSAVEGATSTQPGWLEQEVTWVYDQIRTAALADTLLYTNAEFEQAAVDVKTFARDRSAAVRAQVAAARSR